MEEIKVEEWLKRNNGSGSGDGSGYGYGDGDGYGYGYGSGYGSGDGYGDGYGYGYGYGYGDGYGYGSGDGSGDGYGDGDGYGYGIACFNGEEVYMVDGVQTIIEHIKESFAKGFILHSDFTLTPCFIAKGNGYFAHGKTVKEATAELRAKIFENMDSDEAIEKFIEKFKKGESYPGTEFFEWHHYLTGSCLMGRETFVKNKGLNVNDMFTVDEFIELCENDYGSNIIKQLKERWNSNE